ncbi:hypothetical protein ACH5RR_030675 [Cinchona calisaya]|uniref:Uncharacterized protein n=1 Tax=Cinchona calisaya TaxID=153742 RepID=A0ABD2YVC2_9GENT
MDVPDLKDRDERKKRKKETNLKRKDGQKGELGDKEKSMASPRSSDRFGAAQKTQTTAPNCNATAPSFNEAIHGLGAAANYSPVVVPVVADYLGPVQTSIAAAHNPHAATYATGVAPVLHNNVGAVDIDVGVDGAAAKLVGAATKHVGAAAGTVYAATESYSATARTSSAAASFIETSREITEVTDAAAEFRNGETAQNKNTSIPAAHGL